MSTYHHQIAHRPLVRGAPDELSTSFPLLFEAIDLTWVGFGEG